MNFIIKINFLAFGWRRCAMRTAVVCFAIALGESVPRFDVVMSLLGGTLTGPIIFIIPPLLYTKIRKLYYLRPRNYSNPEFGVHGPNKNLENWREQFLDPRIHSRYIKF